MLLLYSHLTPSFVPPSTKQILSLIVSGDGGGLEDNSAREEAPLRESLQVS